MDKKSVKKNYLFNLLLQISLLIIPIITTPYTSRVLGAEKIGEFSFYSSIVSYFVIFSVLGTSLYGQRRIAYYRDDQEKKNDSFWNVFFLRVIFSLIALILYFSYCLIFESNNILCLLLSYNVINVILDVTWYYQGIEEFKFITLRSLFVKIVCTCCIFVFVNNQNDLWIYVGIHGASTILGNILVLPNLRKTIHFPGRINPFDDFKEVLLVFLPTIAVQVYTILDKSMIGWITHSSYQNGCYDRAENIAKMCLTIVTAAGAVILPRIANLLKNDNYNEAKIYILKAFKLVYLLSFPIAFGLFAVSNQLIPLYLGEGYEDAILLLEIFSPLVIFIGTAYVTGYAFLIPANKQNVYTISVTIAAIFNIIINIILIPQIGSIGAAISTVIAEALGCLIQLIYCWKKKYFSFYESIMKSWKYFVSGIIMFVIVLIENHFLTVSIFSLCIEVLTGIFVYALLVLLLHDDFVIDEIKNSFIRKKQNNK